MGRDTPRKARTREYQARAAYARLTDRIADCLVRADIKRIYGSFAEPGFSTDINWITTTSKAAYTKACQATIPNGTALRLLEPVAHPDDYIETALRDRRIERDYGRAVQHIEAGYQETDTPLPPGRVALDAGGGSQKFL